jgi:nicotinamidase-related amidase
MRLGLFVAIEKDPGASLARVRELGFTTCQIGIEDFSPGMESGLRAAVEKTGRKKLIMAALWTEVCLAFPVISAIEAGYEVYIVVDASGATTMEAHQMAIQRMIQAGAVPVTWLQVLLEFQRDWARQETYEPVLEIAKDHAGAYGLGIFYAKTMLGGHGGG